MASRYTSYELKKFCFSDFQVKYAETLLIAGADPNISKGNQPLLLWTLQRTFKDCKIRPEIETRELLLKYNADVNNVDGFGQNALHYCVLNALHFCVMHRVDMIDLVKKLLATGVDPNKQDDNGQIPLFFTLKGKNIKLVELLLECSDLSLKDRFGKTALHAIWYNRNHVAAQYLTRLLELGSDKEAVCHKGNTVLCQTILSFNYECLKICIDAGCNVNVRNSNGETNLGHILSMYSPEKMEERMAACELLIDGGADLDSGECLVELAAGQNFVPVVKKLLQANWPVRMTRSFHAILDFMGVALREKDKDCAVFIFGDSCSTVDQVFFYDVSHQPDAMLDGESIGLSRPPISLYRLSRRVVRSLLPTGPAFIPALHGLPLPRRVQDFVALRP